MCCQCVTHTHTHTHKHTRTSTHTHTHKYTRAVGTGRMWSSVGRRRYSKQSKSLPRRQRTRQHRVAPVVLAQDRLCSATHRLARIIERGLLRELKRGNRVRGQSCGPKVAPVHPAPDSGDEGRPKVSHEYSKAFKGYSRGILMV
jgi:hypothetical protein